MPKPDKGEMYETLKAGEYTAIISEVISIGTQTTKNGKKLKKYWINCFIPSIREYKAISNFGITNWKSKQTYPNVGLYELISAVLKTEEPSKEDMKEYNVYDLAGKTVVLVTEEIQGHNNVTGVKIATEDTECDIKTIALDIDEAIIADMSGSLPIKVSKMVRASFEYSALNSVERFSKNQGEPTGKVNEDTISKEEIKLEDIPF